MRTEEDLKAQLEILNDRYSMNISYEKSKFTGKYTLIMNGKYCSVRYGLVDLLNHVSFMNRLKIASIIGVEVY